MVEVTNKITIPLLSVIFLAALGIVVIQHFAEVSFGFIGFISWIIVIFGAIYFVLYVLAQIFGW